MKEVKIGLGRGGETGRFPGLLYSDNLVLFDESEEGLRVMLGHFVEV